MVTIENFSRDKHFLGMLKKINLVNISNFCLLVSSQFLR